MFDFDDSCGVWRIGPVAASTAITTVAAIAATTATVSWLSRRRGETSSGIATSNFAK